MLIKDGVSIGGVRPELLFGLMVANGLFGAVGEVFVITSVTDGERGGLSYHPGGFAFDCRLPVEVSAEGMTQRLAQSLGAEFDVVLEDDHIHVEYEVRRIHRN